MSPYEAREDLAVNLRTSPGAYTTRSSPRGHGTCDLVHVFSLGAATYFTLMLVVFLTQANHAVNSRINYDEFRVTPLLVLP